VFTEIKENIIERLVILPIPIQPALLFGSRATGTQTDDSDIDVLTVSAEINPKRHRKGKEIARIKEWLSLCLPLDILLLIPDECISNFRNHNPLLLLPMME
jgi:predicted nucleotidyltransferase